MAYTVFWINGTSWVFSPQKFSSLMEEKKITTSNKPERPVSNAQIYDELADLIHVTPGAVKKWKMGKNAFSDESYIQTMAEYFGVDETALLVPCSPCGDKPETPDNRDVDRAEVSRVFGECMRILFQITHFKPEKSEVNARQQRRENAQSAVGQVRSLRQGVYAHSLLLSPHIANRLYRLLFDMEKIAESELQENPWEELPESVNYYDTEVYCFQYFLGESKKVICLDSPDIDGVCYVCDEIDYADDLGLGDIVKPDDAFYEHCDDAEVLMKYGYHGDRKITPVMVYDHILTKYMSAVFRYHFPELFEDL